MGVSQSWSKGSVFFIASCTGSHFTTPVCREIGSRATFFLQLCPQLLDLDAPGGTLMRFLLWYTPKILSSGEADVASPPNLEFMLTKLECVFQILTPDLRVEQAVGFKNCVAWTIDLMFASKFVAKHIHEHRNSRNYRQVTAEQLNRLERRVKFLEARYLSIGVRVFHCIFMRGEGMKNPPFPSHKWEVITKSFHVYWSCFWRMIC